MGKKEKEATLDCGARALYTQTAGTEFLAISLIDLYQGYGELNDPLKLAALFTELHQKGYKLSGLSRVVGYYDSTDDLILDAIKST